MALRTFRSSDGTDWQVWSVLPGAVRQEERRIADRRNPEPILRYTGPERRSGTDRRAPRLMVRPGMEGGWLTFESEAEKRRLVPFPAGWEELPDTELERLCKTATAVPKLRP